RADVDPRERGDAAEPLEAPGGPRAPRAHPEGARRAAAAAAGRADDRPRVAPDDALGPPAQSDSVGGSEGAVEAPADKLTPGPRPPSRRTRPGLPRTRRDRQPRPGTG